MQPRLFVNIFLLLIAIALIFFLSQHKDENNAAPATLTRIDASSIDSISILHRERRLSIARENSHWQIHSPINIAANDFRIGTLLKLLSATSHSHYEAGTLELDNFGLSQPLTSIRFNETEIEFGIVNPINNYRYVKIDNTVHLVDDLYYPLLSSQLGTLVSLNVLDSDSNILKLELPEQTFYIDDNDNWQSTNGIPSDVIVETLNNWKKAQAFGVHDLMERQLLGNVRVYLENNPDPVAYVITSTEPWLIIARPELGIEYHFNSDAYGTLINPGVQTGLPQDDNNNAVMHVSPDDFLKEIRQ